MTLDQFRGTFIEVLFDLELTQNFTAVSTSQQAALALFGVCRQFMAFDSLTVRLFAEYKLMKTLIVKVGLQAFESSDPITFVKVNASRFNTREHCGQCAHCLDVVDAEVELADRTYIRLFKPANQTLAIVSVVAWVEDGLGHNAEANWTDEFIADYRVDEHVLREAQPIAT